MNADLDGEDSRWLIVEDGFTAALANTYETLFTTGNGYLGTRSSLQESHEGALPGTFLRGVFDHHDSAVTDLVKAPDWLALAVVVNGIRLDVTSVSVVRHRRILDMREGAVFRDTVFEDSRRPPDPVRDRPLRQRCRPASMLPAGADHPGEPRGVDNSSAAVSTARGTTWIGGRYTPSRRRTIRR